MRSKFISLLFSVFLIGLGSAVFFFEVSDYTFEDGYGVSIGEPTVITNTYSLEGIDRIDSYGAQLIIDETQEGVKVELIYDADLTKAKPRTFTMISDCTLEQSAICDLIDKDKVTTMVINYNYVDSRFNLKEAVSILIDQAKNKTIINIFNLAQPKIKITLSSKNMGLLNN